MVVRDLVNALGRSGVENTVVSLTDRRFPSIEFPDQAHLRLCGDAFIPKLGMPASFRLLRICLKEVKKADLVHLHEMWNIPQLVGGIVSRAVGCPYIVSPHGALEPLIAAQHKVVKAFGWAALQKPILDSAGGIHVLTEEEMRDVRSTAVKSPIRVIPNGVDVDAVRRQVEDARELQSGPGLHVLFLGRMDSKKGLDLLLASFAVLSKERRDVRMTLAGPGTRREWDLLRQRARILGIEDCVSYLGFVETGEKFRLLSAADLFVLPSRSEGFSIALLEALACGIPTVASTKCNIPEVESYGAGRVVEPVVAQIAAAMGEILDNEGLRGSMRRNAERLAREAFSADRMAGSMLGFYEEILSSLRR